jgi:hypothetical protein
VCEQETRDECEKCNRQRYRFGDTLSVWGEIGRNMMLAIFAMFSTAAETAFNGKFSVLTVAGSVFGNPVVEKPPHVYL